MVDVPIWHLKPPTPSPVPLLLSCGLVEPLNQISSVWSQEFYICMELLNTDVRGISTSLEIAPEEPFYSHRRTHINS